MTRQSGPPTDWGVLRRIRRDNLPGIFGIQVNVRSLQRDSAPVSYGERRSDPPIGRFAVYAMEKPEEEIIRSAQGGDRTAFECLYVRHVSRVYALCLRLTGRVDRAEESTQDAFVRAWQKLGQFRFESSFSSWLHRLTVNLVLAERRSRRRREARIQAVEDLDAVDPVADVDAGPVSVEIDLERAIPRLPEKARVAFVLHDIEGYRHDEIADFLGIAVGTSKTNLHRARRLLRRILGEGPSKGAVEGRR